MIRHERYLYRERQDNTYHRKLEEYATALRDVLEMSETELTEMTNFMNITDSQDGFKEEWQNQVRILLDLRSNFFTSSFRDGKLWYPSLPKLPGVGPDNQTFEIRPVISLLDRLRQI